jgi:hypothetical protein
MCTEDLYVHGRPLCARKTSMCTEDLYVHGRPLCARKTSMCMEDLYVHGRTLCARCRHKILISMTWLRIWRYVFTIKIIHTYIHTYVCTYMYWNFIYIHIYIYTYTHRQQYLQHTCTCTCINFCRSRRISIGRFQSIRCLEKRQRLRELIHVCMWPQLFICIYVLNL